MSGRLLLVGICVKLGLFSRDNDIDRGLRFSEMTPEFL
jgi:hypothetical protein